MLAFTCALACRPALGQGASRLILFAAASLKNVLDEVMALPAAPQAAISFGGSGVLARQITLGAPADLFISADPRWIDALPPGPEHARVALMSNRLVLVGPAGSAPLDPADLPEGARIVMGLVSAVPAGTYGKAAFEALGLWDRIAPGVVETDNVRAALALVARGELPFGVVYATDAQAEPRVDVLARFPAESHPKILYEMVMPAQSAFWREGASQRAVAALVAHLRSDAARAIYDRHGFEPA